MNRRSFLSITSAICALVSLPKTIFAVHGLRYAERFVNVVCAWIDGMKLETYRVKLFADRDRDRMGALTNDGKNLFVWEVPLRDVEAFLKNGSASKSTRVGCRYENFTLYFSNTAEARLEKSDGKLIVRFFENEKGYRSGHCEIDIDDVDFLLTQIYR